MRSLTYIAVTLLLNTWIIAFLGYNAGGFIHILLFLVLMVIAFRIFNDIRILKAAKASRGGFVS